MGINCYLEGDSNSAEKLLLDYISHEQSPQAGAFYYMGLLCDDAGKVAEAGSYFQRALELEPNKGLYHFRLGLVYSQLMLFERAIIHLERATELNPEHVRAYFLLGSIYLKNGDLANASANFRKVIRISPEYALAHYELGNALYYAGDTEGATKAFTAALELNSEIEGAKRKLEMIKGA
jgi:tetratricopeptide (TPR) repeat protein